MSEIKVGMIVQLISGGSKMTVQEIQPKLETPIYCLWFSGSKLEGGHFRPESLIIIEEEKKNE